jgi:hypothetical protein
MATLPAAWRGVPGGGSGTYSFAAAWLVGLWAYLEGRDFLRAADFARPRLAAALFAAVACGLAFLLAFRAPGRVARGAFALLAGAAAWGLLRIDGSAAAVALLSGGIVGGLVALDQFTLKRG